MKKNDERITKDIECIHCIKFFDCAGKPAKVKECLCLEEGEDYGREKNVRQNYYR